MWLALLKLVPFRDYLYAALAIAGVVFWIHHDHVEQSIGAARCAAAMQAASAKAEKDAEARIALLDKQYADQLAKVKETYESQLANATAQHASDMQRLRDYDTYRKTHPTVGSPAPAPTSPDGGPSSFDSLGNVAATLADALRQDDAQLQQCWAERDSLTGK